MESRIGPRFCDCCGQEEHTTSRLACNCVRNRYCAVCGKCQDHCKCERPELYRDQFEAGAVNLALKAGRIEARTELKAARQWSAAWKAAATSYRRYYKRLIEYSSELAAEVRELQFRIYGPHPGYDDVQVINAIDAARRTGQQVQMPEHTPTYEELQREVERLRGELERAYNDGYNAAESHAQFGLLPGD